MTGRCPATHPLWVGRIHRCYKDARHKGLHWCGWCLREWI